jgi:TetR/AcrR family transcriptional regulator, transcriptional repressor for nem operon
MLIARKRPSRRLATPRDPERTRGRLLKAAFKEMHRSGFRSADLDAILAKAGVTKGALYYHFDNKEALGYAVVEEVIASKVHQKWVQPLQNAKNPIDVLIRIIQSESMKREDVQRGCYLLNLSQEMSGLDEGFRRRTARVYKDWHDAVAEALREGQKRRVVRSDINANETATFLLAAWEGYAVLGKNSQDPRMLRSGQRSVSRHLEALRPARGRARAAGRG